jgi:hypothetical protein
MCPSWMNQYLPKTPPRVRHTLSRKPHGRQVLCVQRDFGSHPMLKIDSSNFKMMTHPQRWFRCIIITLLMATEPVQLFANAVLKRQLLLQHCLTYSVDPTLKVNILGFKQERDVQRIATWWQFKQSSSVCITGTVCILRRLVQLNTIIWWWWYFKWWLLAKKYCCEIW